MKNKTQLIDFETILEENYTKDEILNIKNEAREEAKKYLELKKSIAGELNNYIEDNNLSFKDIKNGLHTSTSQTQRILKGESGFTLETILKVGALIKKRPKIVFE